MGLFGGGSPDIAVPEPTRTRPKEPPEKEDTGTQQTARKRRRQQARGTGDTVLSNTLGDGGNDQTSSLLGG